MKFNNETNKYLDGELFSNGLDIHFSQEKFKDESRIEKIIAFTKNKNVIHLGCADHLPLIDEKIKNGRWLHKLLTDNTKNCIGFDINQEAISYIQEKLNIKNVHYANILQDEVILPEGVKWDYIILGELIEHVNNPVDFLSKIKEKFEGKVEKILITAPNVYNISTIKDIKNNRENINTDHRYWFSPYTLTKIVKESGFTNCELFFADRVKLPFFRAVTRRIKSLFKINQTFSANCFSNLILIADF